MSTVVALVTGANKGLAAPVCLYACVCIRVCALLASFISIGKEIAMKLCAHIKSELSGNGVVLVGARDEARGKAAVEELSLLYGNEIPQLALIGIIFRHTHY